MIYIYYLYSIMSVDFLKYHVFNIITVNALYWREVHREYLCYSLFIFFNKYIILCLIVR